MSVAADDAWAVTLICEGEEPRVKRIEPRLHAAKPSAAGPAAHRKGTRL